MSPDRQGSALRLRLVGTPDEVFAYSGGTMAIHAWPCGCFIEHPLKGLEHLGAVLRVPCKQHTGDNLAPVYSEKP